MSGGGADRSFGELFAALARETITPVPQELHQTSTELGQRATGVSTELAVLAGERLSFMWPSRGSSRQSPVASAILDSGDGCRP